MSRVACAMFLGLAVVAGCESAIVGATCQDGFALCEAECVNLEADFRNCGACGNRCSGFSCYRGTCGEPKNEDAGADTGNTNTAGRNARDAQVGDPIGVIWDRDGGGFDPDAGLPGCGLGTIDCAGACVDLRHDPAHCGACGRVCASTEVCAAGRCTASCDGELRPCGGRCYDVVADPDHCGGCDDRCASGICEASTCADAIAGQVVVIGHDFTSANGAMRRIAGNAVFLARGAPVRVLSYQGAATAASVRGVEDAIEFARSEIGRSWQKTEAVEASVPLQLLAADVFLIHAQFDATDSTLQRLGRSWGNALAAFLARGGTVVAFETPSTRNGGTYRILDPARIFGARRRSEIAVQTLSVKTPGSGVAVRVPDRYMSASHSVRFEGMTTSAVPIVVDQAGDPVVVQRVIVP